MLIGKLKKSLNNTLVSGIFYTAIARYTGVIFLFFVSLILTRLIPPKDFGAISLVMIFINFFSQITIMGISPAIVQIQDLTEQDVETYYTLTYIIAIVISVFVFVLSPVMASVYKNDILKILVWISVIHIFFALINTVPNALALRNKDFKFIAIRTVIIQCLTGIASVVAAFSGCGIYSLLISPVVGSVIIFFITLKKYYIKFSLTLQISSLKKIFSFSIFQIMFNICVLLYNSISRPLLGYYGGFTVLGYYDKAYFLIQFFIENISQVVTPVLHPVLAEHQNDNDYIYNYYIKLIKIISYPAFFISGVLFIFSKETVILVLGRQWVPSIDLFRIFSCLIGILIIQSLVGAIFQAKNKTNYLFIASFIALMISVISYIPAIIYFSAKLFVMITTAVAFITFGIYHTYLFKTFNKSIKPFVRCIMSAVAINIAMICSALLIDKLMEGNHAFLILAAKIILILLFLSASTVWYVKKYKAGELK